MLLVRGRKGLGMKMKQLLTATALVALPFSALAADLPMRSAAPAPAPMIIAAHNWTGFYLGAHAGYSLTKPRYTEEVTSGICGGVPGECNINPNVDGFAFGSYAGFNRQSGALVYGVEADISFGSVNAGADVSAPITSNYYSAFTQRWSGNVRTRVGYSFGSALLYVAGGVAFANIKDDDVVVGWNSASNTHVGWTIGAGVDYALSQNWIGRGEYLYSDFGRKGYAIEGPTDYVGYVKPQNHTFRVGVAYKFGGSSAPVVARY